MNKFTLEDYYKLKNKVFEDKGDLVSKEYLEFIEKKNQHKSKDNYYKCSLWLWVLK